jgi:hypothetical protein
MKVGIHQPNYLPYIGFFNKVKQSDLFVLLDTAQYVKNDFHNRNRIRVPSGEMFLTIPIPSKECFRKRICDVPLPKGDWAEKHWKAIVMNYGRALHFREKKDFFEKLYAAPPENLGELNCGIIMHLLKEFKIATKIVKASEMNLNKELKATDLLVALLKQAGATGYISGRGRTGKEHYLEEEKFAQAGIALEYQEFTHPVYKQAFPGFVANMAAIDLLFNEGDAAAELI